MGFSSQRHSGRFWNGLQHGWLWNRLRRIAFLRSALYLAIELRRTLREPWNTTRETVDRDFKDNRDPWQYETNPLEQVRFRTQAELLDQARAESGFQSALEIGCAEGVFTEIVAERCERLLVLDLSPTALSRTKQRRRWPEGVRFDTFDLRTEEIPGTFDLIVVAGVLEYFSVPDTFRRVRAKLVAALNPGGCILIESTRVNRAVEDAWWGRRLIRGRWMNSYIAEHPALSVVSTCMTSDYVITLCRKTDPAA